MTDEQHAQYSDELNIPYSSEELNLHLEDRLAKSLLEILHAKNYKLITLTQEWMAYAEGTGKKPQRNLWRFLAPGSNRDNSTCDDLDQLSDYYSKFEYGSAPIFPIAFFCSRSTATLLHYLEEFRYTKHLDIAERASKDLFTLITNENPRELTQEQFKQLMEKSVRDFVGALEAHAREIHQYHIDLIKMHKKPQPAKKEIAETAQPATKEDIEKAIAPLATKQDVALTVLSGIDTTTKRIDDRAKNAQRKSKARYTKEQLIAIHTLWLKAQQHPSVKGMSDHKPSYSAALQYFRKEFAALGVNNAEDLGKALKAWWKISADKA